MVTPTMRAMADAVREGDEVAALALADALHEQRGDGARWVEPVRRIAGDGRLRAFAFGREDADPPEPHSCQHFHDALVDWLDVTTRRALIVPPWIERIEVYESKEDRRWRMP